MRFLRIDSRMALSVSADSGTALALRSRTFAKSSMSRPLRIQFSGAVYHVMSRGNARQTIFLDDKDYRRFLDCLQGVGERLDWQIWGYCLMTNHYHLLLETRAPNLARGMHDINGSYSQAFNRRHQRVGHVFQGRYRAVHVERDSYVTELARYIVLNPVRAGLCARAEDWQWSSHRDMFGRSQPLVSVRALLPLFGPTITQARTAYAAFVAAGTGAPAPEALRRKNPFLGSDAFMEELAQRVPHAPPEVVRIDRAVKSLEQFRRESRSRNAAIQAAYTSGGYTLAAIGRHFGLHYATVSRIARQAPGSCNTRSDPRITDG